MIPLIIDSVVSVETVMDEQRVVERTVRELVVSEFVVSVDPTPFMKARFVVEIVETDNVD